MTKEELNSVRQAKRGFDILSRRLTETETALWSLTPLRDGLPGSRALGSRLEQLTLKRLDVEMRIKAAQVELEELAIKLAGEVCSLNLPAPEETVLLLRYVECLSWGQVVARMRYPRRTVFKMHERALKRALDSTN